jgi:putative drug exporter of the RND superfamily
VLSGPGIADERARLAAFEARIGREPGVASVVGPGDQPLRSPSGVFLAPGGGAARFIVVLDSDPTGATATGNLGRLEQRLPQLLGASGLGRASVGVAGDTAITSQITDDMQTAFLRVGPAALALLFVLLWALLRSWTAPLYLIAVSVLVVAAALGLTVFTFQDLLGYGEVAFFVPIATAILLLALGSDYNVFLVGRIWREAERRDLRDAVRTAGSRAARAIAVAGLILALSFAALALIPTQAFREVAFAMCAGLLIDAFVARTLLIPALIVLFGRGVGASARGEADRQEDEPGHHTQEEAHSRA